MTNIYLSNDHDEQHQYHAVDLYRESLDDLRRIRCTY